MNKVKWPVKKIFVTGLTVFICSCCLLISGYIIAREIDLNSCYERIGKDMRIPPTYIAISNAINLQVQEKVHSGMQYDEVMAELEKISPVVVVDEHMFPDGDKMEMLTFKVCPFPDNGIGFLAVYSKDGTLKSIREYAD